MVPLGIPPSGTHRLGWENISLRNWRDMRPDRKPVTNPEPTPRKRQTMNQLTTREQRETTVRQTATSRERTERNSPVTGFPYVGYSREEAVRNSALSSSQARETTVHNPDQDIWISYFQAFWEGFRKRRTNYHPICKRSSGATEWGQRGNLNSIWELIEVRTYTTPPIKIREWKIEPHSLGRMDVNIVVHVGVCTIINTHVNVNI